MLTDGRTDRWKNRRLYRTLPQAGAIKNQGHYLILKIDPFLLTLSAFLGPVVQS